MTYDFDQFIDRRSSDSSKWRRYDQDVLPLWVADMDFPSPEPVIQALRERVEHSIFGYGIEPRELRSVIVDRLLRLYGWQVAPESIVFVPGVVAGFNLACRAVASPNGGVLMQTPIYHPMLAAPGNARLTREEAQLMRREDGHYEVGFDALESAFTSLTRLYILCNPHNPVGRVFQRQELERIADMCLRHNVVICSDEIHCDLLFSGSTHIPIASLAPEVAERTITLMAPSKTFNTPGLRCSMAIIQNQELRQKFEAARTGIVPGVNLMGFAAALAAYKYGQPWLDEVLHYLENNRDFLVDYVNERLPGVTAVRPEATYLAWLDCSHSRISGNPHQFFLQEARVALNDGCAFGRGGEGFVRLNFACPRSLLTEGLHRMKKALMGLDHLDPGQQ
ncbi:MAG: PatB family C-S lyase [Chloroflexota bacterium]